MRDVERRRLAEQRRDLLCQRFVQIAELTACLEPLHELGRRADADVAHDECFLEPLPVSVVSGVERRGRELARERAPRFRQRVTQAREHAAAFFRRRCAALIAEELLPRARHRARA